MNVVCLAGNLTKDPETRSTQGGKQVASFSIAINEGKDKTEFVNCVAWEKSAEIISQYVHKGDRLSLTGRIQTRKWEDQTGNTRYATEVVVSHFDLPPRRAEAQEAPAKQEYAGGSFEDDVPFMRRKDIA